jgi:serine/threonine-protein kinase
VTIDTNQFWSLLSESKLVGLTQVQSLFTEFADDSSVPKNSASLAQWLVQKKALTSYQTSIMLAGHPGPFQFGNYTVTEKIKKGSLKGHFLAQHTKTGFPVLLQFLEGSEKSDLEIWNSIDEYCQKLDSLEHPNLVTTFETLVLPQHRFVVSGAPSGPSLADKLPRRARLPWKQACGLMAHAANGLDVIHQAGVVHNAISPRALWIQKSGLVQVRADPFPCPDFISPAPDTTGVDTWQDFKAPECYTESPTIASDLYSLGCTLVRVVTGRQVFAADDIDEKQRLHEHEKLPSFDKYKLPTELESLIRRMLAKDPDQRPKSANEVCNVLSLLSGKANEINELKISISPRKRAFLKSINQFLPSEVESVPDAPAIKTEAVLEESTPEQIQQRAEKIQAAALAAGKRKREKWKIPVAIAGSLLALSAGIGYFAMQANNTVVQKMKTPEEIAKEKEALSPPVAIASEPKPIDWNSVPVGERPILVQELIDDDRESLWESPTQGPPVDFANLPVSPKLLYSIRPSNMMEHPEGQLLLKSVSPGFESYVDEFTQLAGFQLEEMDHLIVSLHTTEEEEYASYFVVTPNQPLELSQLLNKWNSPTENKLDNGEQIFLSADNSTSKTAFYVLKSEGDEASLVTQFAFGNRSLVEEAALSAGANVLSGALKNLAERTDAGRHLNMLFLRNSLFNEQGQRLMGDQMLPLNRELRILIPDDVRGGLVSLHIDSGSFFELTFDRNFDLKARDLKTQMVDEFRSKRDSITELVATIPSNPYWDKVRVKYDNMLADFHRNLRWDVEHGEVVANCWLSPMAAHNLIAASELAVAFSAGISTATTVQKNIPQTLEALLATKRDLNIANPPDLNVLLAELVSEIKDDFGKLPFEFNIRLLGGDLEKDGITKNQRPSELVINQKSFAEILTSIMVKANPDKDITGASDPNCKLIWVLADDPDVPGQKAILITTRAAAATKNYELPAPFLTE